MTNGFESDDISIAIDGKDLSEEEAIGTAFRIAEAALPAKHRFLINGPSPVDGHYTVTVVNANSRALFGCKGSLTEALLLSFERMAGASRG